MKTVPQDRSELGPTLHLNQREWEATIEPLLVSDDDRGIALREDRFLFPKRCDLSRQSCRIEKNLGIECALLRGFYFGTNLG